MQNIYVSFAQIRPNHVCDQSKTNSNDVTYDACANAQEMRITDMQCWKAHTK